MEASAPTHSDDAPPSAEGALWANDKAEETNKQKKTIFRIKDLPSILSYYLEGNQEPQGRRSDRHERQRQAYLGSPTLESPGVFFLLKYSSAETVPSLGPSQASCIPLTQEARVASARQAQIP